jgi:hypothetical protein
VCVCVREFVGVGVGVGGMMEAGWGECGGMTGWFVWDAGEPAHTSAEAVRLRERESSGEDPFPRGGRPLCGGREWWCSVVEERGRGLGLGSMHGCGRERGGIWWAQWAVVVCFRGPV